MRFVHIQCIYVRCKNRSASQDSAVAYTNTEPLKLFRTLPLDKAGNGLYNEVKFQTSSIVIVALCDCGVNGTFEQIFSRRGEC